ncbi:MAG TPA: hypothetical protein VFZ28_08935 [Burkholderiaceae bacterium]|nr:hypothetical protein [Burkholderiaceae bacterium]
MLKGLVIGIVVLAALIAGYFAIVLNWNYSSGERAGWVQQFSHRGWLCKTWEGELALVSLPGSTVEKFHFTVRDDAVAAQINKAMGHRVTLHYEQKVGLPTSCFGETRFYVDGVTAMTEVPLGPGVVLPTGPASAAAPAAPVAPAASMAPVAPAAPAASR